MKIDKNKIYRVSFVQWLNDEDVIEDILVTGRRFFRLRNFLSDLGYEVKKIEEVSE